jgi:hypothetical protein
MPVVDAQKPPEHRGVVPAHAVGLLNWPHELHVSTPLSEQPSAPGAQMGAAAHEQVPQAQVEPQDWVPYVLHDCVAFGEHTPLPAQVPLLCQVRIRCTTPVWLARAGGRMIAA